MPELLHSLLSSVWSIFLVVLFFGGSIFVHELGHFLVARWRGLHVERFSIGFGPAIWSWRGRDGVEYRIAWLPLGGYVLLPQLADLNGVEGRSEVAAAQLPSVSYGSKMLVFVAGVCCNLLFAFVLACVVWAIGQPQSAELASTRIGSVSPRLDLPDGSSVPSPAAKAGLQAGDTIRAIDGRPVKNWEDILETLVESSGRGADGQPRAMFTVERNGRPLDLVVYPRIAGDDNVRKIGIAADYELQVDTVAAGSAAARAGFRPGDAILSLNGALVRNISVYLDAVTAAGAKPIVATVRRGRQTLALAIPARAAVAPDFGLSLMSAFYLIHVPPLTQLATQVTSMLRLLGSLINPRSDLKLSSGIAGPIGIVQYFHEAAENGLAMICMITIAVNISLATINLLPLPVFDGGQMVFATIAWLRGRALPLNFVATAQLVAIALVATIFIYLSYFDIRRWVRDSQADRPAAVAKP